jgi:hypothetical protein
MNPITSPILHPIPPSGSRSRPYSHPIPPQEVEAELIPIQFPPQEVEAELSELVVNKTIYARINRPAGIINFGKDQKSEEKLGVWTGSISRILESLSESSHLIQKEKMMHEARAKLAKQKK